MAGRDEKNLRPRFLHRRRFESRSARAPYRLGHGRVRVGEVLAYDLSAHPGGVGEAETSSVWVARLEADDLEADDGLRAPDLSGKKLDLGVAVVPVLPGKGRARIEGELHEGLLT